MLIEIRLASKTQRPRRGRNVINPMQVPRKGAQHGDETPRPANLGDVEQQYISITQPCIRITLET